MDTLAAIPTCRHMGLRLVTGRATEFVDITDRVQACVEAARLSTGLVNIQTLHTTTAIALQEHEPLLLDDFSSLLQAAAPDDGPYRHDDLSVRSVNVTPGERCNGHAHCRALLLNPTASLNVVEGRLQLGRWQRVFLVELDGPRVRELSLVAVGEPAR
jgi:secondary thiamine-phosphate synthase enzyme